MPTVAGPYDLSLVEGSITHARAPRTHSGGARRLPPAGHDRRLRHGRRDPGPAQLRRRPASTCRPSTPIPSTSRPSRPPPRSRTTSTVDLELHGCPIDRGQLLEVMTASLPGASPIIPAHSVCQECKARGTVCLLVARGTPASARSPGPVAARSALRSTAAASAASVRPRRPTRRRSPRWLLAGGLAPVGRVAPVPHVQRRCPRLPGQRASAA